MTRPIKFGLILTCGFIAVAFVAWAATEFLAWMIVPF